jgi:tetratricopeptide (TPR) repeat protein
LKITAQHVADRPLETLGELAEQLRAQRDLFAVHDEDDELFSLPAVFSWSYRALAPDTARVFRLVGLHPGTRLSNDTAAALADLTPQQATRHLGQLTRVNLLDLDVAGGFRIHDLLHSYAHDCALRAELSADRRDAIVRLLDFYVLSSSAAGARLSPQSPPVPPLETVSTVRPLEFATDEVALKWCTLERSNLIAATRLAVSKGFAEHAWRLPAALQEVFERSGFHDDMLISHELVLESATTSTHPDAEIGTRNNLALMYLRVRRLNEALQQFEACLDRARELGHRPCEAAVLHNIGTVHFERGRDREALRYYQASVAINRQVGGGEGEAFSFHRVGQAHHRLGNFTDAKSAYLEALRIRLAIGHVRGQGATLTSLAELHHETAEPETALEFCLQALRAHQSTSDRVETGRALAVRAAIEFDLGEFDAAREHAEQAASLAEGVHDLGTLVKSLHLLGHALAALGHELDAVSKWRQALDMVSPDDLIGQTLAAHLNGSNLDDDH